MIKYEVSTAPTSEPLTLAEVREFLKLDDDTSENDLINSLIVAARNKVEMYTNRKLFTQTIKAYLDAFPSDGIIKLSYPEFQSITSVKYYDTDGTLQTVSSSNYHVDIIDYQARLQADDEWPTPDERVNAVVIEYVSGWSSVSDIPDALKTAMKLMIGFWHSNREDSVKKLPSNSEYLMHPYKVYI